MMFDAVIVGGGPAGLSAALMLGRCTRRVLVCDSGSYRNEPSRALHGFLSRDGIRPSRLRALARDQLRPYDVEVLDAQVTDVEIIPAGFRVHAGRKVEARKLVLATGLVDALPAIAGVAELLGRGVYLCPYCDAWERRARPLAVHGAGGAALARSLLTWSRDVVWFSEGPPAEEVPAGVTLEAAGVVRVVGRWRDLRRVELADGRTVDRQGLFLKLAPPRQRSVLARQLGLRVTLEDGIEATADGVTSQHGVFVAGDASRDALFAIQAAAEGLRVAVAVNTQLEDEKP